MDGGDAVFNVSEEGLFIPYGDYPHTKGLQKFTKQSAEKMVAAWNSLTEKVRRVFTGIPVYIGHPDVPELRKFYPDTKAYGWVEGIQAENDGMRLPVKWTEAGKQLVEGGHYKFYSPFWLLKKVAGGISPVRLLSVGLTNNNNIPVPALANEAQADPQEGNPNMPTWLLELLGLPAEATEEQTKAALTAKLESASKADEIKAAHDKIKQRAQEVDDAHAKLQKAHEEMRKKHDAAANEIETLKNDLAAANTAHIALRLEPLIKTGKVLIAEKDGLTTKLLGAANEAELQEAFNELEKRASQLKTKSETENLGKAKQTVAAANDAELRSSQRREAVDAEEKLIEAANSNLTPRAMHDLAWRRAEKKNPDLFGAAAK